MGSPSKSIIPDLLVSEEALTGQGAFALYEGDVCIGSFDLDTNAKTVSLSHPKYIFHVFSEDYVNEQIRNKLEHLDGEITHEIIIGKENAELDEKTNELSVKNKQFDQKQHALNKLFRETKQKHQEDFSINASLGSFRQLNLDKFFEPSPFKSDKGTVLLSDLLFQYNRFKSLPSHPRLPTSLKIPELGLNAEDLQTALSRITSPSSVADEFKQKLISDQTFFEKGLVLYKAKPVECPFCTQSMSEVAISAVTAYSLSGHFKTGQRWSLQNRPTGMARDGVVLPLWDWTRQARFSPPTPRAAFEDVAVMEQPVQHGCDGGGITQ